jgi:hypothetical protein
VEYLGTVGGATESDTVERVMAAVMDSELARTFNWNGTDFQLEWNEKQSLKIYNCATLYSVHFFAMPVFIFL